MAIKISYEDLQIISSCLTSVNDEFTKSLDNFLKVKKDDYYFYGREVNCTKTLEITTNQLEQILSYIDSGKYDSIHKNLNSIYQSSLCSKQKSVFLYGRLRNAKKLSK